MFRRWPSSPVLLTVVLVLGGCWDFSEEQDTSQTEVPMTVNPKPHAMLVAHANMGLLCASGVTEYTMVAVQVACEPPPPAPCTMPSEPPHLESDSLACADGGTVEFRTEVLLRGRYAVQLVPDGDWSGAICLGEGQGTPVPVAQEDLDERNEIFVDSIDGAPCP